MAWYDEIANTTKGNVQGLVNALRNPQDAIVNQFKQGALYKNKEALAALVRGDTAPIMNSLNTKYPVDPNEAVNAAMMLGTIKGVGNAPFQSALDLAQHRASLPVSEGGLGLPKNNTGIDRSNAMGNIDVYHGGNTDIRVPSYAHSGKGADQYGSAALYTATSPHNATGYVKPLDMLTGENSGGNVMPLKVNPTNFLDADAVKALTPKQIEHFINNSPNSDALSNWGDVAYEGKNKVLRSAINSYKDVGNGSLLDQLNMLNNDFYQGNPELFNKTAMDVTGHKGVMVDIGSGEKFMMPWETSNIRSRFAAFDPFRRNESDVLAGVGAGVGLSSLNTKDEKNKYK